MAEDTPEPGFKRRRNDEGPPNQLEHLTNPNTRTGEKPPVIIIKPDTNVPQPGSGPMEDEMISDISPLTYEPNISPGFHEPTTLFSTEASVIGAICYLNYSNQPMLYHDRHYLALLRACRIQVTDLPNKHPYSAMDHLKRTVNRLMGQTANNFALHLPDQLFWRQHPSSLTIILTSKSIMAGVTFRALHRLNRRLNSAGYESVVDSGFLPVGNELRITLGPSPGRITDEYATELGMDATLWNEPQPRLEGPSIDIWKCYGTEVKQE